MSNDLYGTHAPILKAILGNFPHGVILEDGGGFYSTPIFLSSSAHTVITVEEDEKWRSELKKKFDSSPNWRIKDQWSNNFFGVFPNLVFVDGERETRTERANQAFKAEVPIVIVHDTEMVAYYGYNKLESKNYTKLTDGLPKQTSVYLLCPIS